MYFWSVLFIIECWNNGFSIPESNIVLHLDVKYLL